MAYEIDEIAERARVEDVVTRLFVATDERDWPAVEACFTDPMIMDMTSMTGGEPSTMRPGEISAAWSAGFEALDHVHHQVGNYRTTIEGDTALVQCYGIAIHYRADVADPVKTRTFVGSYDFELAHEDGEWRIALMRFKLKFLEGNRNLEGA